MSRWKKDKAGMIVKVAEAAALRSAFPVSTAGMYIHEEADSIPTERVVSGSVVNGEESSPPPAAAPPAIKKKVARRKKATQDAKPTQDATPGSPEHKPEDPPADLKMAEEVAKSVTSPAPAAKVENMPVETACELDRKLKDFMEMSSLTDADIIEAAAAALDRDFGPWAELPDADKKKILEVHGVA
jgi:hypothetical protein